MRKKSGKSVRTRLSDWIDRLVAKLPDEVQPSLNLLAAALFVSAIFSGIAVLVRPLIAVPTALLAAAAVTALLGTTYYRPPENHLGVIFRYGRFHRFAPPDKEESLHPLWDRVQKPISLDARQLDISLTNLLTKDIQAVDLDVRVTYRLDSELLGKSKQKAVSATRPADYWEKQLQALVKQQADRAVSEMDWQRLLKPRGRDRIRELCEGSPLRKQLENEGLKIEDDTGFGVRNIRPAEDVWRQTIDDWRERRARDAAASGQPAGDAASGGATSPGSAAPTAAAAGAPPSP